MTKIIRTAILWVLIVAFPLAASAQKTYRNANYSVNVSRSGEMDIHVTGTEVHAVFRPDFCVSHMSKAPRTSWDRIPRDNYVDNLNYRVLAWDKKQNIFEATNPVPAQLAGVEFDKKQVVFRFSDNGEYTLVAVLSVPADGSEPKLQFKLTAIEDGSFMVGYNGAPATKVEDAIEVWQPLVWTQKRFPGDSYMTADFNCSVPMTSVQRKDCTYGVCVSPESFPFQPLPTSKNVRFGVSLRNRDGYAQPIVWAPVLGMPASKLNRGDSFDFGLRLVVDEKPILDVHEQIALGMYGLSKYHRDNQLGYNLNTTFDNMVEYGMSEYSWFVDSLKGCSYETDVKRSVKNTSSLNPLNISFVADRRDVFDRRFIPMFEFVLSRENLLFALHDNSGEGGQRPSSKLGKPIIQATEAYAVYEATGRQSGFLLHEIGAEKSQHRSSPNERYWKEQLALYSATGNIQSLDNAVEAAQKYLEDNIMTIQDGFDYKNQSSSSFWTSLSPRFPELFNLYEATGDKRFLEAARYGARRYAQFLWMCPAIPDATIRVNEGGVAPKQKPWGSPMKVPEEDVEAWRLSEIGLHCECAATAGSHRAVFPVHFAAYMRRIADATGDEFLEKIANWAIVGRYSNFPGYHINTARTTVYEKPWFPLHTHQEMNVNSMHYNHIWPLMSIVLDYLVTDVEVKSRGNIHFPAIAVEAFSNLGCRMYGHSPGDFYGHKAILWMPRQLLVSDNPQLNYISARDGKDRLYVALSNQALEAIESTLSLDQERIGQDGLKLSLIGGEGSASVSDDGKIIVCVPEGGLLAFCLDGVNLDVAFQDLMLSPGEAWRNDYAKDDSSRAMLINLASAQKSVFAYACGDISFWQEVSLNYKIGNGEWTSVKDREYPFEFSVEVPEEASSFEYYMSFVRPDGSSVEGKHHILSK